VRTTNECSSQPNTVGAHSFSSLCVLAIGASSSTSRGDTSVRACAARFLWLACSGGGVGASRILPSCSASRTIVARRLPMEHFGDLCGRAFASCQLAWKEKSAYQVRLACLRTGSVIFTASISTWSVCGCGVALVSMPHCMFFFFFFSRVGCLPC